MERNPERKLWYELLRNHPVRFRRQLVIGNYIVDVAVQQPASLLQNNRRPHAPYVVDSACPDAPTGPWELP